MGIIYATAMNNNLGEGDMSERYEGMTELINFNSFLEICFYSKSNSFAIHFLR